MKKITKFLVLGLSAIILIVILIFNHPIANVLDSFWQFLKELNPVYFIILILLPFAVWTVGYYHKKNKIVVIKYNLKKIKINQGGVKMVSAIPEKVLNAFQDIRASVAPNALAGSEITIHQVDEEKGGYFTVWYKEYRIMEEGTAIFDWFALIDSHGNYKQNGPYREKSTDGDYVQCMIKSFQAEKKRGYFEFFLKTELREDVVNVLPSGFSAIRIKY